MPGSEISLDALRASLFNSYDLLLFRTEQRNSTTWYGMMSENSIHGAHGYASFNT